MILVTGGAGFIGSNIVAALAARGESVLVCDALGSDEKWRNLAKHELTGFVAPDRLAAHVAPATFVQAASGVASRLTAVVHMGAISSTTERDGDLVVDNNFHLTLALWEWCARHEIRFIYASSAATYGDGEAGFDDAATPQALARLRPLNLYGWSKHVTDRRIARLVHDGSLKPPQWAGLKFFNVYGPNEYHKGGMRSVVVQAYEQIVAEGHVRLFKSYKPGIADGGQQRDFVSVDDCVAVVLWLLDHAGVSGLFNLGTGQARSFADLAAATFRAMNRSPEIRYIDMPPELRGRYQYWTEAPMRRLREAGYATPFLSLEEGVARYVQDYLSRPDRYR